MATTFNGAEKGRRDLRCRSRRALRRASGSGEEISFGTVVPVSDNFFATLNSAVFSDGSFVYVPPGVRCPMELLPTYFRINEKNTGQFERTLIIADKGSYVSYLEGCTAVPMRDENQLHAAVVELVALDDAEIKYSTVQNWVYPGDAEGKRRHLQFRHQARRLPRRSLEDLHGPRSRPARPSPGSIRAASKAAAIPRGEFYSIAISNGKQQVDSGTKMLHLGKNTTAAGSSPRASPPGNPTTPIGAWRWRIARRRRRAQLHELRFGFLIGGQCGAHTVPYIEAKNSSATFEHEATTSKISEEMLFPLPPAAAFRPKRRRRSL